MDDRLVLPLEPGELRDRTVEVTLTLVDGTVLRGRAPKPARTRPAGPRCDPPQRLATVDLR